MILTTDKMLRHKTSFIPYIHPIYIHGYINLHHQILFSVTACAIQSTSPVSIDSATARISAVVSPSGIPHSICGDGIPVPSSSCPSVPRSCSSSPRWNAAMRLPRATISSRIGAPRSSQLGPGSSSPAVAGPAASRMTLDTNVDSRSKGRKLSVQDFN